ncbi:uncharacterized protein N0V89_001145 [Didymosphaeria variabile]|uniref:Velvet domain-containing protein n=1 Tax=Didymosphaeria variabile TaxID=1932322 RepID=A0A9W8XVP3_9PLEO|nr:uncharacterized protein N0V89_001145 [Didymosphaeria variabile]KAJ4360579.1 hypothetical protein N0V89_001145 [Didymosphaeria variabile]
MDMYMQQQYAAGMYTPHHSSMAYHGTHRASRSKLSDNIMTDAKGAINNPDITLVMRQEPKEALVLSAGKEKSRKPVDPPPIVQLKVNADVESSQHFLQSPYLFVVADLWKPDKDERWEDRGGNNLYGGLCSSLHRLKDIDNKDGGFFIFGDISVKMTGSFRLHFSLYDLQKEHNAAVFLGSVATQPFKCMAPKDFQGLEESTYLSRAFSDQGVRLRLRKEPRAFAGQKRTYFADGMPPSQSNAPGRASNSYYEDESPQAKRYRADTEDRKESYVDHAAVSQSNFSSSYTPAPQASFPVTTYAPQAGYTPSYTSLPQPGYSSSFAPLSQTNYAAHYLPSSPYHHARPPTETRQYNVGAYASNINLANIPQSMPQSIPQSIPQPSLSHYPDIRAEESWDPYAGLQNQPASGP